MFPRFVKTKLKECYFEFGSVALSYCISLFRLLSFVMLMSQVKTIGLKASHEKYNGIL
jgi:hypothetical protein